MGQSAEVDDRLRRRFNIGRCLGAGTFGVVYEAHEAERGAAVALKKLSELDASAIYSFKQEFRALADVVHPNLVTLHELFSIDDQLYLSMELIDGIPLLDYLRRQTGPTSSTLAELPTIDMSHDGVPPLSAPPSSATIVAPSRGSPPDLDRLRHALPQLAAGIYAIHRARKLHRDLKPSNVLVTTEGRVVILDFGLVAGVTDGPNGPSSQRERRIVGTPAYMSPEQARGLPLTAASDWYSLGVILYEALTGDLPIDGTIAEILTRKQTLDPPDPRGVVPDLPDDLADLAVSLLQRDPKARPTGPAILRALGGDAGVEPTADVLPFIGREHHVAALDDAFAASRAGQAVTVLVHGTSGMGKSALVRRFLDVAAEGGAVVLEGRCYERESVPFKALDSLVDALADYLGRLPREEADPLVPADVQALARLFPALRRAEAVAFAPRRADAPDPQEIRRRASVALRDILRGVAASRSLVLLVDDLQWGDADSATLLLDLLTAPDAPPLLFLASYRSEDSASIELVQALRRRMARGEPVGDVRELVVGPLEPREARALARALANAKADSIDAEAVAREAGGSPLFVQELVRHVLLAGNEGESPPSIHGILAARIARLPEDARRLLETVAVAARPLRHNLARRAAGLEADAEALAALRAERLVRARGTGLDRELEPFHDRIRETAVARLAPDELAAYHLRLGRAIEAGTLPDPEALAVHFTAAGELEKARVYIELAADRAADALAFDRAAELYKRALEGAPAPQPLRVKLAHALANAGRGADAARAYLTASEGASDVEALDLRRRAAEQLLRSGRIDEGLAAVTRVLDAVGLSLPKTPSRALASLVYRRALLSLRGFGFTERPESEVPPDELRRIDLCWSVGNGLGGVDIVRAADFQARHLLYALGAGEPYRVARALAWEGTVAALEGGESGRRRAAELNAKSTELAERIRHPHALAWAAAGRAGITYYAMRWREAVALGDRAIARFRSDCADITWEVGSIEVWWVQPSLWYMGRFGDLARRVATALKTADDLGDLYDATSMRTYMLPRLLLLEGRPSDARRVSSEAIGRWSREGFHTQHLCDMYSQVYALLYEGDRVGAFEHLETQWRAFKGSLLMRLEIPRVESVYLRGVCAAGAAAWGGGDRSLRIAEKSAKDLDGEDAPFAPPFARAVRAAVAALKGRRAEAARLFGEAASMLDLLEMSFHAAVMRRRQGQCLGEEGEALVDAADRWMFDQGVKEPARMAEVVVPEVVG